MSQSGTCLNLPEIRLILVREGTGNLKPELRNRVPLVPFRGFLVASAPALFLSDSTTTLLWQADDFRKKSHLFTRHNTTSQAEDL